MIHKRHNFLLHTALYSVATVTALFCSPLLAQGLNPLVTGKKITLPPLGVQANIGSLPMNMVLTPDGRYAITSDMGFRQSLSAIDVRTGQNISHLDFPNDVVGQTSSGSPIYDGNGLYYGLAAASNGDGTSTVYASQGARGTIAVIKVSADGLLTQTGTITLKGVVGPGAGDFTAGLALDGRGYLYIAVNEFNNTNSIDPRTIFMPGSLAIVNTATRIEVGRYSFVEPVGTLTLGPGVTAPFSPTNFPLSVAALGDGSKVYVSSQRDSTVYVVNTSNPAAPKAATAIPTGQHPISLLLNKAQTKLYVANAHSDTISVVNTATDGILSTVLLRPTAARSLAGATPTGLGLSPDEKTLYVSLGDMNAVATIDAVANQLTGYIPAGWYPTAVISSPLKKQLLVANAKGTQTRYPNPSYQQFSFAGAYDLNLIEGNVLTIPVPSSAQLSQDTQQVLSNNKITSTTATPPNPLASINLKAGKIKHVFYIIKENRTYDQVLGDLAQGNGDPSLVLFGKTVTPNLHAIASRFVLLDNFYDNAEASGDGWPWSTQGQANEYVIKNLPYNYSGRGRNYDFEGSNNNYPVGGFPATDPYGAPLVPKSPFHDASKGGAAPAIPDVSEAPGGHIWDNARANINLTGTGLTTKYRNYGFFALFGDNVNTPDNYPADSGLQPAGHDGGGITDIDFREYSATYADSEGPMKAGSLYPTKTYGHYNAPSRFTEWNREFQQMLAADPNGSTVPAFETVRFMHDHTQGLSAGVHTPQAEVADNDYAIGQFVEAISHSKIWDSTAIFIIEDDAQDGPDHVDSHRSTCYVISPYIKKNSVDHTFYNTDSVLKTMELLLNIPPMNQYDAVADPILDFDTTPSNGDVYAATLPDTTTLGEIASSSKTSPFAPLYALTDKMDFVHPDSAPVAQLNAIIWKSVKGVHSVMPAIRHSSRLPLAPQTKSSKTAAKDRDDD